MKRIITLLSALVLMICAAMPVLAADSRQRVYDYAGLFSESDTAALEEELAYTVDTIGMDAVVLTSENKDGATLREYADDFYDNGGFGTDSEHSGLVIFIDMEDRTVYIGTTGTAIRYYTDARIYNMTDGDDVLYGYLANGDYRSAVERCLEREIYYYNAGIESGQHNYDEATGRSDPYVKKVNRLTLFEIILSVLIPGIVAFSYVRKVKDEYMMKAEKKQAASFRLAYRALAAFAFAASADELVSRNVSRRIAPIVKSSGGSGGSSAGRSTIHMGGSGTFHGGGGGGRHF